MNAEFSHRSLHGHPRARRRLFIATALILLVVAVDFLTHGVVRGYVRTAASSLWVFTGSARSSITGAGYFSTRRSLAAENAALRAQLSEYQERATAYAVVSEENAALRSVLQLAQKEKGITAPIVSSFRASPYGTFLIGAGVDDVSPGALVLTLGGFVVGQVTDVSAKTSLVSAVLAADSVTDARIGASLVAVTGRGGGNARASIPRGVSVNVGDPVTAPTFGGRAIGIVGRVESDPANADQTVYIQLPINVSALKYIYIIQ